MSLMKIGDHHLDPSTIVGVRPCKGSFAVDTSPYVCVDFLIGESPGSITIKSFGTYDEAVAYADELAAKINAEKS
jgi:hypothetical protein